MTSVAQQLESDGMAHVRGLFDESELDPIRRELIDLHENFNQLSRDITTKSDANSGAEIREISHLVKVSPVFQESPVYQKCYELAGQIFGRTPQYGHDEAIFKAPGGQPVDWHQDQTYSKYDKDKQCVSIWIPLQNTSKNNGGMQYVLNGRENLREHNRVTPSSFMYRIEPEKLNHGQGEDVKTVSPEMTVGDVCVHTPLCIHRSHPNNGEHVRIAWILQFNKYGRLRFLRLQNLKQYLPAIKTP